MSHPEQMQFVERTKARFSDCFRNKRVLEVGSRNVNGTVRVFFENCEYVGLDCVVGRDVDVVSLAHAYVSEPFDVVITTEALEHDPHWRETVGHCVGDLLKPGGLFVGTWASPLRQEHGTRKTSSSEEGLYGPDPDYYHGIPPEEFRAVAEPILTDLELTLGHDDTDVYAIGVRKG